MGAVGGLAAASSGVRATEVELATSHADGACAAHQTADAGGDSSLAELELVRDLATETHGHAATAEEAEQAVSAVVGVRLTTEGGALTTDLAGEAEEGVKADGGVAEAAEGGAVVGHTENLLIVEIITWGGGAMR